MCSFTGAFGWFLNRSFDPNGNHRTDEFGGTPEKRTHIFTEVLKAVRRSLPKNHISTKLGFYSHLDDEEAVEQYLFMCEELEKNGIDSIEVSCNYHLLGQSSEAGFLPLGIKAAERVHVPVILVGGHRHIENMEEILNETPIEYFSLSRALIREPGLPNRWESGDRQPARCVSCDGCFRTYGKRCRFLTDAEIWK